MTIWAVVVFMLSALWSGGGIIGIVESQNVTESAVSTESQNVTESASTELNGTTSGFITANITGRLDDDLYWLTYFYALMSHLFQHVHVFMYKAYFLYLSVIHKLSTSTSFTCGE